MKLQYLIMKDIFKKNYIWVVLFLLLITLSIVLHIVNPSPFGLKIEDYYILIGHPTSEKISSIQSLMLLYNVGLLIYISYIFYTYELSHSFENIIIRISSKKWILNKMISFCILVSLVGAIRILGIFLFFKNIISLKSEFFIITFLYNMMIYLITISLINKFKITKKINFLIIFFSSLLVYNFFNTKIILIINIILIIFNILTFNFKKITK